MENRGIKTAEEAEKFLNPDYARDLHDPFLLPDMEKAVVRIFEATEAREKIAVFADYDCDGLPGAAILHDFFRQIGHTNIEFYIPDRNSEGYGLSIKAVEKLAALGAKVLITVDLGTGDIQEVATATALGLDVIITDHHLVPPDGGARAYALVNPKLGNYPEPMICGAGVAFKLVQALVKKYGEYWKIPEGFEKWLLDLVAIGTLSDMVPLLGENRALAHFGLKVLRRDRRPGLTELWRQARVDTRFLSEDDIAFTLAPRINAASRMHVTLDRRNIREVVVIGNPKWRAGVLGLVAGRLCEELRCPVFVWGGDGESSGELKGSCRSDGSVSVVDLMSSLSDDIFTDFGGHELSGGFSMTREQVHFLEEALSESFRKITPSASGTSPLSRGRREGVYIRQFGKGQEHLEITFLDENGPASPAGKRKIKAICFFARPEKFTRPPVAGGRINMLAHIELSRWNGSKDLRLRIVDII
ncbi:MAG: Single-stranded-DNA-specific exonuclease RecJ [Parcubacteria group bacterium GW2011_GWA2_42_18]|nr:MAG: Single-stranded-DNA-specific exonuclease RecJ [Parcubacteria group bacterium GW2011_GWA2_42_18]